MSSSLEIIYYPRGFSKGKKGKQKIMPSITIGKGEPVSAIMHAIRVLRIENPEFWVEMDDAFVKYALKAELADIARRIMR